MEYRNLSLYIAAEQRTHHFVQADFHIAGGRCLFLSCCRAKVDQPRVFTRAAHIVVTDRTHNISPSLLSSAPQPKGCLHIRSRLVIQYSYVSTLHGAIRRLYPGEANVQL
jgi:hypothetical protein